MTPCTELPEYGCMAPRRERPAPAIVRTEDGEHAFCWYCAQYAKTKDMVDVEEEEL